MKKKIVLFCIVLFLSGTVTTTYSCSKKTGCPINENARAKPNKKGEFGKKRGKSNLFPKKMR